MYPLIVDIIMPAMQMIAFAFTANIKQRLDSDQVENLSEDIAKSQQASASTPILRRERRKGQSAALGVAFSCPITIDTTNAEDNKKFILKTEKQLKSSNYPNK